MEKSIALEYNSRRVDLSIPEYGRHVQKLIKYVKTIDDTEERQKTVEGVVNLMLQMNPKQKNAEEYTERLWKHIFRIADYDLNVSAPEGIDVSKPAENAKPATLNYPQSDYNHRHYGHNVQVLIENAIAMEDEEKKVEFMKVIAAYMKLAYRTWNKEHYVNDEIIKADIARMSKGKLELEDDYNINNLKDGRSKNHSHKRNRPKAKHTNRRQRKRPK